ncbi:MAG TPA: hypothetical protein VGK47_06770, partial [Nitrososphaeraceae archaeon]
QCPVCKNIESHSTNHFGGIYTDCKKCGNSGLQCIEPQAMEAREGNETIKTVLHKYKFDTSLVEEKKQYETLKTELKAKGLKLFDCINSHNREYWNNLPGEIEIETSYVFDNQWNSSAGRVFDWYEDIYDNRKIKRGYWLELTEQHVKAREPKQYECTTYYEGNVIGTDRVSAINTGEASNVLYNKYFKTGMDIWEYKNDITIVNK